MEQLPVSVRWVHFLTRGLQEDAQHMGLGNTSPAKLLFIGDMIYGTMSPIKSNGT
jgi:hypothetical protein